MEVQAPSHPIDELRAARRDLLAALQGRTASDLLRPGVEGDWCGRDVLLHMAAWLRELVCLVPDLATYGYQRGTPCDPGPDWAAWNAAQLALDADLPTLLRHKAARWHRETLFGDTRDLRGLDQYHLISTTAIVRFWGPAVYSLLEEEQARRSQQDPRHVTIGRLAEHRCTS